MSRPKKLNEYVIEESLCIQLQGIGAPQFSLPGFCRGLIMVSLRRSRKLALLAARGQQAHRRSARLVELEERKRKEAAERAAAPDPGQQPASGQLTGRKRGRKRKHVSEVSVNAVNEGRLCSQWLAGSSNIGSSSRSDFDGTPLPSKKTLESVLDMLQLMDSSGMLAMPNDLQDHEIEENLREPRDLGTVRAKLHESCYPTLEHFERDILSVTSKAKSHNSSETSLHKVASCIAQKAVEIFHALRTQPGFELQVLTWGRDSAAYNSNRAGQLRIGGDTAGEPGGTSSSPWPPTPPSGAGDGNEAVKTSRYKRPCSTSGNRNVKTAGARSGAGTKRYRRKRIELPTEPCRDVKQPQCRPEDRRWTYLRQNPPDDFYNMVMQSPQLMRVGTDISYEESLMRFARAGGPIAERIARKKMEEMRAAVTERMERRNEFPSAPAAAAVQCRPPVPNSDVGLPSTLSSNPYGGLPPSQADMLLYSQQGDAGRPAAAAYDSANMGQLGQSIPGGVDPTVTGGFSFPPPSFAASAGLPGFGAPYCPTYGMGNSAVTGAYKFCSPAANVPPSILVGKSASGSASRGSSTGEGSSTGFWVGSKNVTHAPLVNVAASVESEYQQPLAQSTYDFDLSGLFQLGSCSNMAASNSGKLPLEPQPIDGFQYLLSADDCSHLGGSGPGGDLSSVTSADVSSSLFRGGRQRATVEAQAPEPRSQGPSQAALDLKLLHSRLGENPWGQNGISALLRPWGSAAMSNNPISFEVGSSNGGPAELSTLDLLGENPDLNLNL